MCGHEDTGFGWFAWWWWPHPLFFKNKKSALSPLRMHADWCGERKRKGKESNKWMNQQLGGKNAIDAPGAFFWLLVIESIDHIVLEWQRQMCVHINKPYSAPPSDAAVTNGRSSPLSTATASEPIHVFYWDAHPSKIQIQIPIHTRTSGLMARGGSTTNRKKKKKPQAPPPQQQQPTPAGDEDTTTGEDGDGVAQLDAEGREILALAQSLQGQQQDGDGSVTAALARRLMGAGIALVVTPDKGRVCLAASGCEPGRVLLEEGAYIHGSGAFWLTDLVDWLGRLVGLLVGVGERGTGGTWSGGLGSTLLSSSTDLRHYTYTFI
jgi:hypothetical protein